MSGPAPAPDADVLDPVQRRSHRDLLAAPQTRFDGIIVPSARPAQALSDVMELAAGHDCPVLVLCSRESRARNVVALAAEHDATVFAVDVTGRRPLQPDEGLATSRWIATTRFATKSDVASKRNTGLVLSRMAGWRQVLFLDDDVVVAGQAALAEAASLLHSYDIVGLRNFGFPDNSVVCHAIRATDDRQESFIGGGAMAVAVDRVRDFFPWVYNEDWFFFFGSLLSRRVAVAGSMRQERYNPFASSERAKREEFGDTVAEALFALLAQDATELDADHTFWERFIKERLTLIADTIADKRAAGEPARVLKAARQANSWVRPEDVLTYLDHWRQDRDAWRTWYENLPVVGGLGEALKQGNVDPSALFVHEPARREPGAAEPTAALQPAVMRRWIRRLRVPRLSPTEVPAARGVRPPL